MTTRTGALPQAPARCWRSSQRRRRHFSSPRWRSTRLRPSLVTGSNSRSIRRRSSVVDAHRARRLRASSRSLFFVVPNWSDYRFYNWQMSVTRKPNYDLKSLVDRATWFPLQDAFTRTWFVMAVGAVHAAGLIARWRSLRAGERLLVLWVVLGAAELILHDAGNERRFVFFIPAFVALAALALGRLQILPARRRAIPRRGRSWALPIRALCGATWCSVRAFGLRSSERSAQTFESPRHWRSSLPLLICSPHGRGFHAR